MKDNVLTMLLIAIDNFANKEGVPKGADGCLNKAASKFLWAELPKLLMVGGGGESSLACCSLGIESSTTSMFDSVESCSCSHLGLSFSIINKLHATHSLPTTSLPRWPFVLDTHWYVHQVPFLVLSLSWMDTKSDIHYLLSLVFLPDSGYQASPLSLILSLAPISILDMSWTNSLRDLCILQHFRTGDGCYVAQSLSSSYHLHATPQYRYQLSLPIHLQF